MKKLHTIIIAVLFCFIALPALSTAEVVDRIVAVVNDDVITLSELNEQGKPFFENIMKNASADVVESEIQKVRLEILDSLIDTLLIQQEAAKLGVSVLESEVDSTVDSIIAENNITAEQFDQELVRMGTNKQTYRENIKNQMLKSRIVNVEIRSKLVITNERIQEYYDTHYKQSADVPEGYHILQIGISWGDDPNGKTRVEAREAAEMVRQRIAAGDDFSNLAREYSDLPSAEDGGDIGTFRKDEMAPYMLNAIKNILPGETSDVVETPSAFQILKLISANQDGVVTQAPIDTVRNQIKDTIYRQEMEKEYDKWMSDIRNKAYIKKNL